MIARDILVLGGSLLWEPSSLKAFWHMAKCLPRALRQRREIMRRRRVADDDLAQWFAFRPASRPLNPAPAGRNRPRVLQAVAETAAR